MVEYLSGNRIQGSSTLVTTPSQTSWKVLARADNSTDADKMETSTFAAKDHLMILYYGEADGDMINKLTFNGDLAADNENYAFRLSDSATNDSNTSEADFLEIATSSTSNEFSVMDVTNVATKEKLIHLKHVGQNTAGANNLPRRRELVGKWANTSNAITKVTASNSQTGSFGDASELIVLGYNDNETATTGASSSPTHTDTTFWQELVNSGATTSATSNITVNFTAKKYLMIEAYMVGGSGNNFRNAWKLNGIDSGETYSYIKSSNGAGSSGDVNTYVNRNKLEIGDQDQTHDSYQKLFILNKDGKEKLGIMEAVREENDSASDPSRTEAVFKWETTSGQITSVTAHNDQSGNFGIGSYVKVYGAD